MLQSVCGLCFYNLLPSINSWIVEVLHVEISMNEASMHHWFFKCHLLLLVTSFKAWLLYICRFVTQEPLQLLVGLIRLLSLVRELEEYFLMRWTAMEQNRICLTAHTTDLALTASTVTTALMLQSDA